MEDIEASGFNGTAAFMEVRVQSIVVEFILTHVEQLFRDAPLCGRMQEEPWRESPGRATMSYNLPTMLNQGDGPPQIRPYHTIIELNDHKRKGSLKVKKWRSIFNLGRSSNDSKRKPAKAEEKDDKSIKMSLRPAKSMDSLSSVPDANDGSPSSREESFLESDEYPEGKFKGEEGQQTLESESEASAKSEPTTPKAGRASLVGGAPQGRSPMTARNRAEKCAGVHISVPFSVTVPFHITSNISLSRLTRGLECPALSYSPLDKEALERSSKELEAEEGLSANALDSEENRLSMEVQDSFSFLDNQDTWQDCGTEGDQPEKSLLEETTSDFAGDMLDGFPGMDDDMESRFMNPEFSVEPPPEYLSIEECMNEEQYYMATGCSDTEELSKETDSEDVFLSAYDDLSPLAPDLEKLRQLGTEHGWDVPLPDGALGGEMAQEMLSNQPPRPAEEGPLASDTNGSSLSKEGSSTKVPLPDSPHAPELASPCRSKEAAEDPHGPLRQPEGLEGDGAEGEAVESSPAIHQEEDINLTGGDDLEAGPGPPRTKPTTDVAPVQEHQGTWAPESEGHGAQASHAGDEQVQAPRLREAELAPCAPGQEADGRAPEEVRAQEGQGGSALPTPETKQPESGKGPPQPLAMKTAPALSPGSGPELPTVPICESGPMSTAPFLETGLETTTVPLDQSGPQVSISLLGTGHEAPTAPGYESDPEAAPLLETSSDLASWSDASSLLWSGPTSLPLESGPLKPTELPTLPEPDTPAGVRPDGSAPMRVTSSTVRVQQVKSVPIVPPKPQYARMPPTVKMKMHLAPAVGRPAWGRGPLSRASWRNGGSMSFDTAVALAKQRHLAQMHGVPKVEKPPPFPRPALKPVGQRSLRPLSCTSALLSPDALALGKHPPLPDTACEPHLAPDQEPLPFAQEPTARSRLSMPRLGQRPSDMEEAVGPLPQQRRSLAFEIRDCGGSEL
uniref:Rho GTPase activating protein 30 n=1 Tax=Chrysemys picta bellii TaxID=8478 RepID=A0A8C3FP61_CHRPI